jgi:hypothetical protein
LALHLPWGLFAPVGISVPLLLVSCYLCLASAFLRSTRLDLRPQSNSLLFGAGVLHLVADSIKVHIRCVSDFRLIGMKLGFARGPTVIALLWLLWLDLYDLGWPFTPWGNALVTSWVNINDVV